MAQARVIEFVVFEDGGAAFMARIVGHNAVAVQQADVSRIDFAVFDLHSATPDTALTGSAQLTPVSTYIFNSLQTDARWTKDTTGYNFRHDMPAAMFPTGHHRYRVEYKFTPASGAVYWAVYEGPAIGIRTS